jgi:hypothetical protein
MTHTFICKIHVNEFNQYTEVVLYERHMYVSYGMYNFFVLYKLLLFVNFKSY